MKMADMYPSNYLKTEDLQGNRVRLTIASVAMEQVGPEDKKPVLTFVKREKKFLLNKTNAAMLVELFGDESSEWVGKMIVLAPSRTNYQGKMVPCLRIEQAPPVPGQAPPPPPPEDNTNLDDIPF